MPSFRTEFPAQRADFSIGHSQSVVLIGSCFTEHIGARLAVNKFDAYVNPFGIVYNPVSIAGSLERLWAGDRYFTETELFENQGLWSSWEHHGHFSKPDRERALEGINAAYEQGARALRGTDRLLLTLGTADVFMLRETEQVVANNHKMPAACFESRRLSVAQIVDRLGAALQKMQAGRPGLQVVLSVSPVRHLRAGAVENQRSKATLVLACAELEANLPFVRYFPAYELMLDDLRDYRFYTADMIHPSEMAIDYIWQHFASTFFTPETRQLLARIERIMTAARHRPFHPQTAQHREFAITQLGLLANLTDEHPYLDFRQEKVYFQQFI